MAGWPDPPPWGEGVGEDHDGDAGAAYGVAAARLQEQGRVGG